MLLLGDSLEFEGRKGQLDLLLFWTDLDFFLVDLRQIEHFNTGRGYDSECELVIWPRQLAPKGCCPLA